MPQQISKGTLADGENQKWGSRVLVKELDLCYRNRHNRDLCQIPWFPYYGSLGQIIDPLTRTQQPIQTLFKTDLLPSKSQHPTAYTAYTDDGLPSTLREARKEAHSDG